MILLNNINLLQTHYEKFQQNINLVNKGIKKLKSHYKIELDRFTIVIELIDFKTHLKYKFKFLFYELNDLIYELSYIRLFLLSSNYFRDFL